MRKILAEIGGKLKTKFIPTDISHIRDEIVNAVVAMSLGKIGALIAIEREIKLKSYIDKHIRLDALVSKDMLLTIFSPNTPLHDGAVIISEGRIAAANCFFPYPPLLELTPAGGQAPGGHRHQPGNRLHRHRRLGTDRQDIPGRQGRTDPRPGSRRAEEQAEIL